MGWLHETFKETGTIKVDGKTIDGRDFHGTVHDVETSFITAEELTDRVRRLFENRYRVTFRTFRIVSYD